MTIFQNSRSAPQFTSSLRLIATNYAFRCDAKYADHSVRNILGAARDAGATRLGKFLTSPFVKGVQPNYLDQPTDESIPVINTLSIQNLSIRLSDCRHIHRDDFDNLSDERKLKADDVLVTVDGGVSIGKPSLWRGTDDATVDSHVVVLRPEGLSALALVYLLASPLGQMQFRRAESGASGQTTVTEDDIRRFIFPNTMLLRIEKTAIELEKKRSEIASKREALDREEARLWQSLGS